MKGFTLAELIGVIILIGAISLITVPVINKTINQNKENAYNKQVSELERIGTTWVSSHLQEVGYENTYYLTLDQLIQSGDVDNKQIKNPKTKEAMTGCLEVSWNEEYKQHTIIYKEPCPG